MVERLISACKQNVGTKMDSDGIAQQFVLVRINGHGVGFRDGEGPSLRFISPVEEAPPSMSAILPGSETARHDFGRKIATLQKFQQQRARTKRPPCPARGGS